MVLWIDLKTELLLVLHMGEDFSCCWRWPFQCNEQQCGYFRTKFLDNSMGHCERDLFSIGFTAKLDEMNSYIENPLICWNNFLFRDDNGFQDMLLKMIFFWQFKICIACRCNNFFKQFVTLTKTMKLLLRTSNWKFGKYWKYTRNGKV